MTVGERTREVARWIAARTPRTFLIAGWIVFTLGCYPGYMTGDSTIQLYTVRSGDYSDYSPVMTALWGALEYITTGPLPMLALHSGLFLFGLFAVLRKLLTPRVAAITAAAILVFPPVFSAMAVISPDALMVGALLAGIGAGLDDRRYWRIVGAVCIAIACACRPTITPGLVPLLLLAVRDGQWWRRAGIAVGLALGLTLVACVANRLLTVTDTYNWQQRLMMTDTIGTLRRAKITGQDSLEKALAGTPLADRTKLHDRIKLANDAYAWGPLVNGDNRIFEHIESDDQAAALSAAWRRTIAGHLGAYLAHRWSITRGLLAISGKRKPVYDSFGNVDLMAPLHHRATVSDWEWGMQKIVRLVAKTPLFWPCLYLVLAIGLIVIARGQPIARALAISGLVTELVMAVTAPSFDYAFSLWLVTATSIALAILLVRRRTAWTVPPSARDAVAS